MLMVLQVYDEAEAAWCVLNRSPDRAHLTLLRDRWAAAWWQAATAKLRVVSEDQAAAEAAAWLAAAEIEDVREPVLA
jgi:hypothetical protein